MEINMKKKIRAAYTPRSTVYNPVSGEPSRVKQEFKKEVDINEIFARMKRGISPPPWMTSATPRYGDFSNLPTSFQEAHAIVEMAHTAFMGLPLEFRRALDHDPRNLDSAPRELYEQFGLIKKVAESETASGGSSPKKQTPSRPAGGPDDAKASNKSAKKADVDAE